MDRTGAIAELRVQAGRLGASSVRQRLLELAADAEGQSPDDAAIAAAVRVEANRLEHVDARQRLLEAAGVIAG